MNMYSKETYNEFKNNVKKKHIKSGVNKRLPFIDEISNVIEELNQVYFIQPRAEQYYWVRKILKRCKKNKLFFE